MVLIPSRSAAQAKVTIAGLDPAALLGHDSVAPSSEDWKVVDFETQTRSSRSVWGENSLVWTLQSSDGLQVTLSVDYYFRKWHELTIYYRSSGWQLGDRMVLARDISGQQPWQTVLGRCRRPASHEQGLIFFDLFRVSGEMLAPVEHILAADWKERFSLRNLQIFENAVSQGTLEVIQIQAFVVSDEKLTGENLERVNTEYRYFREQIYRRLVSGEGKEGEKL